MCKIIKIMFKSKKKKKHSCKELARIASGLSGPICISYYEQGLRNVNEFDIYFSSQNFGIWKQAWVEERIFSNIKLK